MSRVVAGGLGSVSIRAAVTEDQLVPVVEHRRVHAAIAHSEYVELHSGHVVFAEQPAAFVDSVRRFWSRT